MGQAARKLSHPAYLPGLILVQVRKNMIFEPNFLQMRRGMRV